MALYEWITGVVAFIVLFIVFTVMSGFIGFTWELYTFISGKLSNAGFPIPADWNATASNLRTFAVSAWGFYTILVLIAVSLYIILGSMRRRPEDDIY